MAILVKVLLPVLLATVAYTQNENPLPNSNIIWKPCSGAAQAECAPYQVPLDYAHPEVGKATLAVVRFKATKQPRLGSIFINPGGPGDSGVNFVLMLGSVFSNLMNGQYDIVGWDPRGVNNTKPRISCGFTSLGDLDQFLNGTIPGVGFEARGNFTDKDDLDNFLAKADETDIKLKEFGKKCLQSDGAFLKYTGTAAVVRDMVSLSDALEGPGKPVNYYGFSYGTIIGNYFVNMFPERVGRVIIDGVVDTIMWATEPSYKSLSDIVRSTESTFAGFTNACAEAGPEGCSLAQSNTTSASISHKVRRLLDTAYDRHKAGDPDPTHTSFAVRQDIFSNLYTPTTWGKLASELANLAVAFENTTARNGSALPRTAPSHKRQILKVRQDVNTSDTILTSLATLTIWCVDSIDQHTVSTRQVFDEVIRLTHQVSPTFGEIMSIWPPFYCHRFPVRAVERFTGPFNHTLAHPIIVIGNQADPVTPFSNAKRIADNLGSSARFLKQNGFGHASIAENSNCTLGIIREYFLNGKLPAEGEICETDQVLFSPNSSNMFVPLIN